MTTGNALFLGTEEDAQYISHLKAMFGGVTTWVYTKPMKYLAQLEAYCGGKQITRVVSTNTDILTALLAQSGNIRSEPSLADYQGSLFSHKNLEIVFISPLKQLFTVSYGKFLAERFVSKVITPSKWREPSKFSWSILTPTNYQEALDTLSSCDAIAPDIETLRKPLSIRCIGFTGIKITGVDHPVTYSYVLPVDSPWALAAMRTILKLSPPKIFQNGKYDCSYLLRYNAPPTNWIWDTAHIFHCFYSELPKDLAFLNAFFLRKVVYWKDLAETTDLHEYYRYCALDTWATANVWLNQIEQLPDWAQRNYILEFPLVYPCLLAEMTGLKRDGAALKKARAEIDASTEDSLSSLRRMLGSKDFNPGSPKQVTTLLRVLGCGDITSSGEKELAKAAYRHPLNARIFDKVLEYRGLKKLSSNYLRTDDDAKQSGVHAGEGGAKEFHGRILYALNPHGTDTGRLASREHHFWTGLQVQNIPRGPEVKQTVCADDEFFLGECDLEQAESRDTAHIAGDNKLIAAVTGSKDFHSINASAFFGVSYDSIYDDRLGKTKDKKLRDLAKRVNHGANYNMGAGVLVDTMGLGKIYEARALLKLPQNDPLKIAQHLLDSFHTTYPKLRGARSPYTEGTYYAWVASEIRVHRRLASRAFHHTEFNVAHYRVDDYISQGDWTRYCFGRPDQSKSDLNAYVAHCPQSLNARTLNEAFMKVFYEIALPNPVDFRLHAQIHDSILFSYSEEGLRKDLPNKVRAAMEIPVTVRDVSGVNRTFTVPAALKLGVKDKATGEFKRAKYWSETE